MTDFPKLFIPGPSHVSKDILDVLSTEQIGHRTPEISELIKFLVLGIQKLLYTKKHIYLVSHAATGLWEMGTKNSVTKGVLHAVNGAFSSKWALSSEQNGFKTKRINYEWGQGVNIEKIGSMYGSVSVRLIVIVIIKTGTPPPPLRNYHRSVIIQWIFI